MLHNRQSITGTSDGGRDNFLSPKRAVPGTNQFPIRRQPLTDDLRSEPGVLINQHPSVLPKPAIGLPGCSAVEGKPRKTPPVGVKSPLSCRSTNKGGRCRSVSRDDRSVEGTTYPRHGSGRGGLSSPVRPFLLRAPRRSRDNRGRRVGKR